MGRTDTVSYRRRGQGYNRQYASHNGQIDVLFDTPDSSFTGFTELREIKKHYFYGEEDSEGDEGTCPLNPAPGGCGDEADEEIVDEGTCPIDPEPGDCGGEDYGGCEDPVVDEGLTLILP